MSKENVIITFDLHEVIFTFNLKEVGHVLWNWHHKWAIFTTLFHIPFVFTLIKMLLNSPADEEFYDIFQKRRPILLPLIIEITNAQKVIPGMESLIQELHNQGYTLHILSNIGPRRFKELSADFPKIINYFSKYQIVNPETKPIIKKPNTEFFKKYLAENAKQNQKIIFIDDNKKNILAARSLGINAIRFKSTQQLQTQLNDLGIL